MKKEEFARETHERDEMFFRFLFVIGAYRVGHHRIYGHIVRWD